jgi:hypothetical protein
MAHLVRTARPAVLCRRDMWAPLARISRAITPSSPDLRSRAFRTRALRDNVAATLISHESARFGIIRACKRVLIDAPAGVGRPVPCIPPVDECAWSRDVANYRMFLERISGASAPGTPGFRMLRLSEHSSGSTARYSPAENSIPVQPSRSSARMAVMWFSRCSGTSSRRLSSVMPAAGQEILEP